MTDEVRLQPAPALVSPGLDRRRAPIVARGRILAGCREVLLGPTAVVGLAWAVGCGDGATEPPAQTPDPPRPAIVTVGPASSRLAALGATVQLTAQVRDQGGQAMTGVTVTWASSATVVATVDGSGLVTAVEDGTATITAMAGSASGSASVTVAQVVTGVTVLPPIDTLVAFGDTVQLAAEAADANGHAVVGAEFTWSSSDTAVAVVDGSGLVRSVGAGVAEITAVSSSVAGRTEVTVVAPAATTVAVTPDTAAFTAIGQTARLFAEVRDQAGRVIEGAPVAWSSGDTLVATVDSAGLVAAVGSGATTVTAMADEVSGTAVVTVEQSAESVVVTPAADTVAPGDTVRLSTETFDENGHAIPGAEFRWSSSNASVATVDATGLVRGVAEGTATIAATAGSVSGTSEITVENPDRAALVALYNATDGANWANSSNWLTDAPLGEWHGVRTDGRDRVIELHLGSNELSGTIPAALGKLTHLRFLRLYSNRLSGRIPPELANIPNLQELWLNWNDLSGSIPTEIGRLAKLQWLVLDQNTLSGSIPAQVGNLAKLKRLHLNNNNLSGKIPPELGQLPNLQQLALNWNGLSGSIPPELGDLTRLESLSLSANDLTGPIPAELGKLTRLRLLRLGWNELDGPMPADLGGLSMLTTLHAYGNSLTGPIPAQLGNLTELNLLNLGENHLSGPIPPELGNLTDLTFLYLALNDLTGSIPRSFLQLANLQTFYFGPWPGAEAHEEMYLCAPGTTDFMDWLERIEKHAGPFCNEADVAVLASLYEATGGAGWTESDGWPGEGAVEEWYGITADSLGRVRGLDLTRNGLAGELPLTLGDLTEMTLLRIGDNALSGPLPLSMAQLSLREFHYAGTELCVPGGESFQAWLNAIQAHEGTGVECAPLSDRDILRALYKATGGPDWVNNENWLTDAPLRDWYGVQVDGEGRIVELRLARNALAGPIPAEIGNLSQLRRLHLDNNSLSGRIPPELGNIPNLEQLWLNWNDLSGSIPPEIGGLADLQWLVLDQNTLSGSIPAEIGNLSQLKRLHLNNNRLSGRIPSELGNLSELSFLHLATAALSGPIPPELGSLAKLGHLILARNDLTGPIPPELGSLANLRKLQLGSNALSGPIPPELGNLANLTDLRLHENQLTGPIPRALGRLSSLTDLRLHDNRLGGSIPAALGNLSNLELLSLDRNDLTGQVPSTFGGISRLRELTFANNGGMAGPLPADLTALTRLEALLAGGTNLCAPSDFGFQAWLEGVRKRWIANCTEAALPIAYLTQAVQSREFPVALVAGERGLLRVFPTAARATSQGIPALRARFYVNGRETHVENIPGKSAPIPTEVHEGDLASSANAEIPASAVQPGLEMVIEVDPAGTLDPALGVAKRIPETGRLAVEVEDMPLFDLTLIPFIWTEDPDWSIVDLIDAMAADPETHEMLGATRTLLPVADLNVTAHEPVQSSTNNIYALHRETAAIRVMEGATGYYKGLMSNVVGGAIGLAYRPGRSSFSVPNPLVMAHEFGHNLSLYHPTCAYDGFTEPSYPHANGIIGAWGYDFEDGGSLVAPSSRDVMGGCGGGRTWISDYNFTTALRFRLSDAEHAGVPARPPPVKSLLLWGGAAADSVLHLEPAFVVEAPAALPDSGGDYRITGRTDGRAELFSLTFTMPETADGDGGSSFAFVLPVRPGWEGSLASITLTGPNGSATLNGESHQPMAILRDRRTGQVRGILRDLPPPPRAAMDATGHVAGAALEVLISRGIPEAAAWRR